MLFSFRIRWKPYTAPSYNYSGKHSKVYNSKASPRGFYLALPLGESFYDEEGINWRDRLSLAADRMAIEHTMNSGGFAKAPESGRKLPRKSLPRDNGFESDVHMMI